MKVTVTGLRGFPNVQGGIETHCEQLYPRLSGKGCNVTVFTRRPYTATDISSFRGVNLRPLPSPTNKFLETVTHTFRSVLQARRMSADVLHIHAIGPSLFAPLGRALGMKVVVTTHGPDYERAKWKRPAKTFLKFCERMGMLGAHEVIAIADNIATDLTNKYGRTSTVIPNGVEIPTPSKSTVSLEEFGVDKQRYFLAVGRFVPEKGFHDLIDAFNTIRVDGWKLVIAGKADHEDSYSKALKEKAAKNPDIVLTGFIKGIPLQELYSHAGVFVIPSYYEGLPIVLLEALSYGLPCIASSIPANRNVKLSDRNFFKMGDVKELGEKLIEFADRPMTDDERCAQIAMVENEYNWDKIGEKTLKVYERALAYHAEV